MNTLGTLNLLVVVSDMLRERSQMIKEQYTIADGEWDPNGGEEGFREYEALRKVGRRIENQIAKLEAA
jgi:hypothetical protein